MSLIDISKYFEQPRNDLGDHFSTMGGPVGNCRRCSNYLSCLWPILWNQVLRHWGRYKMAAIFHTTFLNAFLPKGSFGLRVLSLPVSVCVCVFVCGNHKFFCVITHHPFKLGKANLDQIEVQNKLVKIPIVLWDIWPWPLRLNWTPKSKFTQFWACPCHNSPPIEVTISKFIQKCILALFRSLPISDLIEIDLQFNF